MREIFYCSYVSCRSFMFYFETSSLHDIRRVDRASSIKDNCETLWFSVTTVQRTLSALSATLRQKLDYLPHCLLFDEFRSLSIFHGKFSFSCMNWETGKLFDILSSRRKKRFDCLFHAFYKKSSYGGSIHCHRYECPLFFISQRTLPKCTNHHWLLSHWATLEQVFRSCSKTCDEAVESKMSTPPLKCRKTAI